MNTDTQNSPGIGLLPSGFADQGGVIVDMVGVNGHRLTAQIPPASLHGGQTWPTDTFWQLCSIPGFSAASLLAAFGSGGIAKCNIRVTLADGNSGTPNPIYSSIFYISTPGDAMPYSGPNHWAAYGRTHAIGNWASQLNGNDFDAGTDLFIAINLGGGSFINCGYMGQKTTYRLNGAGATDRTFTGFPGVYASAGWGTGQMPHMLNTDNSVLYSTFSEWMRRRDALSAADGAQFAVTCWFSVPTDSTTLASLMASLTSTGTMQIGIHDIDPGDQFYDFGLGVPSGVAAISLFPTAILSFTATPTSVVGSQSVTLAWVTQNCTSVNIDHGVGSQALSGSTSVVVSSATTFTLTAVGPDGTVTATVSVTWTRPAPGVNLFTASLTAPGHVLLQWMTHDTDTVTITGPRGFSFGPDSGVNSSYINLDASAAESDSYTLTSLQAGGGSATANAAVSLTAPSLAILSSTPLPSADTLHAAYTYTFTASGGFGVGTYHWAVVGSLPLGLALSDTGVLSGTLDPSLASQTLSFTIQLTGDSMPGSVTGVFSLQYTHFPLVVTTTQADFDSAPARNQVSYSFQLHSQFGQGTDAWTLLHGSLPSGLSLSSAGVISGTPTAEGYWQFAVQDVNGAETVESERFELMVKLGWNQLDPFHKIFYRVFTTDAEGNKVLVLDPYGALLTNDPLPNSPDQEVFAEVVVAFEVGTGDFTVTDARVQGGGLAPQFQSIEDARNFFDLGYWDGKPYPVGGGMVIYLPLTILNSMNRTEVNAKLNAILPLGVLPVVRYYDNAGGESK